MSEPRPPIRLFSLFLLLALPATVVAPSTARAEQRIKVAVDPRVELLSVVQRLAGARSNLPPVQSDYASRIDVKFRKLRKAPAVQQIGILAERGFGHRDAAALALRLGPLPKLDLPAQLPPALVEHAGGSKAVKQLAKLLRAFARAGKFADWVTSEQEFYDRIEQDTKKTLGDRDYATDLEVFFGSRQAGYGVVLAPLYPPETAMAPLASRDGLDVVVIAGPRGGSAETPSFGTAEELEDLALREMARPFFAGLLAEFDTDLRSFAPLYADVEPAMKKIGTADWMSAYVELAVRAVAVRMIAKVHGPKAGTAAAERYQKAGFAFVPAMAARIADYEPARNRYPDFATFFPRLIAVLAEVRKNKIPPPKLAKEGFDGTLLGALQQKTSSGVIIVPPPGIKNRRLRNRVKTYLQVVARDIQTRRGGFVGVLDEWNAQERDLTGTLVFFATTPRSKMALAWLPPAQAPTFSKKGVAFGGKTYTGKGLKVVQAVRAPKGSLGAIVAMAGTPADLFGIDRCLPEGSSWAVCRGGKVVDQGAAPAGSGTNTARAK